jgi:hypothetical protein
MARKLLFEDASSGQKEIAYEVRQRLINDITAMSNEEFKRFDEVNHKHFNISDIIDYIVNKDDVFFFIQFKNVESIPTVAILIMMMNRGK